MYGARIDVRDTSTMTQVLRGCRVVVHLAGTTSVVRSFEDPTSVWSVEVEGTRSVLRAARAAGVLRVVVASSAAIYATGAADSPYARAKRGVEAACAEAEGSFALGVAVARLFNVYAEGQPHSAENAPLVAAVRHCVERRLPIPIFGDGLQTRDFVHVSDVARALLALAEGRGSVVAEVGTRTSMSVLDAVTTLAPGHPVVHHPPRPGDTRNSRSAPSAALEALGWRPRIVRFQRTPELDADRTERPIVDADPFALHAPPPPVGNARA